MTLGFSTCIGDKQFRLSILNAECGAAFRPYMSILVLSIFVKSLRFGSLDACISPSRRNTASLSSYRVHDLSFPAATIGTVRCT